VVQELGEGGGRGKGGGSWCEEREVALGGRSSVGRGRGRGAREVVRGEVGVEREWQKL